MSEKYITQNKRIITLKEEIGAGNEGAIYAAGSHRIAKIIKPVYRHDKDLKIKQMVQYFQEKSVVFPSFFEGLCWPEELILDEERKRVVGYLMKEVNHPISLSSLYRYPSDLSLGMKIKTYFLIELCRVVARIHSEGFVIGDFNPDNILIDYHSLQLYFIDMDSICFYQGIQSFPCKVCYPGYVAPELLRACDGESFAAAYRLNGTTFTENTDRFCLAIHIFRSFMNGFHPFHNTNDIPIDVCVRNFYSPFWGISSEYPPVAAPGYTEVFSESMKDLFERAFVEGNYNPELRPTELEWMAALDIFLDELKECPRDNRHLMLKGANKCPYCEAERRYNMALGRVS